MRLTEKKRVKIYQGCNEAPVYLRWLNTLGTWDYWLFVRMQEESYTTGDHGMIEGYVEDIANTQTVVDVFKKSAIKKMKLGASMLDDNDVEGLKGLLYSRRVQRLTNNEDWETDGAKWQTVNVNVGSFVHRMTNKNKHEFEITIDYQPVNIQHG